VLYYTHTHCSLCHMIDALLCTCVCMLAANDASV
jgi:hypothetical protein